MWHHQGKNWSQCLLVDIFADAWFAWWLISYLFAYAFNNWNALKVITSARNCACDFKLQLSIFLSWWGRLSERAKHSLGISHLSNHPIITRTASFVFAERIQIGRKRSDILNYDISSKLYQCAHGNPRGLNPFIKLVDLTKYLKAYVDHNPPNDPPTSEDHGTRMILRTQRSAYSNTTTLELLYQINCSGNDDIPVSSFILYTQKDKVVSRGNRRSSSAPLEQKSQFSFSMLSIIQKLQSFHRR
jgi:hypothetical protein